MFAGLITRSILRAYKLRSPILFSALVVALFSSQSVHAETYYKWKDSNGSWIYGSNAPKDVEAFVVKTHVGKSETSKQRQTEADNSSQAEDTASTDVDKEFCERARSNLESLNSGAIIQRLDEDGNSVTLNREEMEIEKDKAKAAIKQFCLGFSG